VARDELGIPDLLSKLREEVEEARIRLLKSGKEGRFALESLDVTVQFVAQKTKGGGFGLRVPFVGADGKVEYASSATQTATLHLTPTDKNIMVAGADNPQPEKGDAETP
jgi:Trypsin-co-occurring domain 2